MTTLSEPLPQTVAVALGLARPHMVRVKTSSVQTVTPKALVMIASNVELSRTILRSQYVPVFPSAKSVMVPAHCESIPVSGFSSRRGKGP